MGKTKLKKKLPKNSSDDVCNPDASGALGPQHGKLCMKLNWLELLTTRLRPLRGHGGGAGGRSLVSYLIEWKMHGLLLWCLPLCRKGWFNGSCQTSSLSSLVLTALRSGMLHIKALAMSGPDGQMFGSCFNSRVNRNTDAVRAVHCVSKGRTMNQSWLSQALSCTRTITLECLRSL